MILKPPSSFNQGDRVQIVLLKNNLAAGADKVYPDGAIGTVVLPYLTDENGDADFDARRAESLADQRIIYVLLDNFSVEQTIPEWLLRHLKPEDDPLYK